MRIRIQGSLVALCALVFSSQAPAQSRCDCTTIVGSCAASVSAGDSFIEISSDAPQCARVDYVVDGAPFVTLVTEGTARQNRTGGSNPPAVVVQSCQVCRDTMAASTDSAFGASLYTDGDVTRLIGVAPAYPEAARDAGIEGFVEVRFTVTPAGTVASPEVDESNPAGGFDQAALAAVNRWRYTGNRQGESATLTERLEFNLARELLSLRPASGSGSRPLAAVAPVRNRCIQEETRYDFGGVVDVSLINACQDPLIVYSCSAGTGQNFARWTCRNPDAPGIAVGSMASSRLELSRAPNSEYWWLACGVDDTGCQSEGRQWVRSLNQQTATIDPQDRTRARLARSY
jgi:TonB family protein